MRYIKVLVVFLFVTGCSRIHFQNPMPQKIQSLNTIDPKLIGEYYPLDSSYVKNEYTTYNYDYYKEYYKELDSIKYFKARIYVDSSLITWNVSEIAVFNLNYVDTSGYSNKFDGEKEIIEKIYCTYTETTHDTILNLNNKDEIRLWNDIYYFSKFHGEQDWEVFQVEYLSEHDLSFNFTNEKDLENLNLTKTMFPLIINLSDRKFKKFVNHGGFRLKYKVRKHTR